MISFASSDEVARNNCGSLIGNQVLFAVENPPLEEFESQTSECDNHHDLYQQAKIVSLEDQSAHDTPSPFRIAPILRPGTDIPNLGRI